MQIKKNLFFSLLRKVENSIFFRIYNATNAQYQNFLFAGFKVFFKYRQFSSRLLYEGQSSKFVIRDISDCRILRNNTVVDKFNNLLILEEYPSIACPENKILRIQEEYYFNFKEKKNAVKINGAIYVSSRKQELFYHAINWVLAQIYFVGFFHPPGHNPQTLIVDSNLHNRVKELLYAWNNSRRHKWIIVERNWDEEIHISQLRIVSTKQSFPDNINIIDQEVASNLKNIFLDEFPEILLERDSNPIYLRRFSDARSGNSRNLANSTEVEKFFVSKGFLIVDMAELSLVEQISTLSTARIIAGVHGGSFTLLPFANSPKIIEIFCGLRDDCFSVNAKLLGFEYRSINSEERSGNFYLTKNNCIEIESIVENWN